MEQFETNKLELAIACICRIADGKDPITGLDAPKESVINDTNVIRCMFFIKEVLEAVKKNDYCVGKQPKREKADLPYAPKEAIAPFVYQGEKTITKVVEQINSLFDQTKYKKIGYAVITTSLKLNGYLEEQRDENGKIISVASEKGSAIGMRSESRTSMYGKPYMATIYGRQAQEFIVKNLEKIIDGEVV